MFEVTICSHWRPDLFRSGFWKATVGATREASSSRQYSGLPPGSREYSATHFRNSRLKKIFCLRCMYMYVSLRKLEVKDIYDFKKRNT